jgi:hypothetical protein
MNKNLFIYWRQGFNNAPDIIKKCLLSWKIHNNLWKIIELDDNNINNYININNEIFNIKNKNISLPALSDIIRIFLLEKYGGCWCDATTFCNNPLDNWLPNYIENGFFAFSKPGPDRLISSWFIYANKNNNIINEWKKKTVHYWNNRNIADKYFWFHYLFNELYLNNKDISLKWDKTIKILADGPHYLQIAGLLNNINLKIKNHIDNKESHLYKLTYHIDKSKYNDKCILYYLLNSISNKN